MNEIQVVDQVVSLLEKLELPYALTGGFAVSYYGEPRSTHDADMVLHILSGSPKIKALANAFEKDYYVSEEGIVDALVNKTMFNLIHHETGLKIDFFILKDDEYNQGAFRRRRQVKALGRNLYILAPEDMVLNKLLWFKAAQIDKHLNDAKNILEFQKDSIDNGYLNLWAIKLGLTDLLKSIS